MAIESSGVKITGDVIKTKLLQDFSTYDDMSGAHEESALFGKLKYKKQNGGRKTNYKKIICYDCNKKGHFTTHCREKPNPQTLVASYAMAVNCASNFWLIDSGATAHTTKNEIFYCNFENFENEQYVMVPNGTHLKLLENAI